MPDSFPSCSDAWSDGTRDGRSRFCFNEIEPKKGFFFFFFNLKKKIIMWKRPNIRSEVAQLLNED